MTPSHEVGGGELSCRAFQAKWNIKELLPVVTVLVRALQFSSTTIASICINFSTTEFCLNHNSNGATFLLKGPATQNAVCRSGLRSLSAAECYILSRLF